MVEGISELSDGVLLGERYRLVRRLDIFAVGAERVAGVEYEHWLAVDVTSDAEVWIQFAAADGVYATGPSLAGAVSALRRINHPAVPAVFAFGEYEFELEGTAASVGYCAVPAAEGETLVAALLREELDQAEILAALAQVAEVLELLAEFELVHGHLSARSVLLTATEAAGYEVVLPDLPASLAVETAIESELTVAADVYALAWLIVLALIGPAVLEAEFGAGFAVTAGLELEADQVVQRRLEWAAENLVVLGVSETLAEVLLLALGEAAGRPRAAALTAALRAEWMLLATTGAEAVAEEVVAEGAAEEQVAEEVLAEEVAAEEIAAEEIAAEEVAAEAAAEDVVAEEVVAEEAEAGGVVAAGVAGAAAGAGAVVAVEAVESVEATGAGKKKRKSAAAKGAAVAGVVGAVAAAEILEAGAAQAAEGAVGAVGGVAGAGGGAASGAAAAGAAGGAATGASTELIPKVPRGAGPKSGAGAGAGGRNAGRSGAAGGRAGGRGAAGAAGAAGAVGAAGIAGAAAAGYGRKGSASGAASGSASGSGSAAFSGGVAGSYGGGSRGGAASGGAGSGQQHGPRQRPKTGVLLGAGLGLVIVIALVIVFSTGPSSKSNVASSGSIGTKSASAAATNSAGSGASQGATSGAGAGSSASASAGATSGASTSAGSSGSGGSTAASGSGSVTFPTALVTVPASPSQALQEIQTVVNQAKGELSDTQKAQLGQVISTLNQEINSGQSLSTGMSQFWALLHSNELPSSLNTYLSQFAMYLSASQGS